MKNKKQKNKKQKNENIKLSIIVSLFVKPYHMNSYGFQF